MSQPGTGKTVDIHLVPHTHWDREWYHPVGRFRQRLVTLIDELLDAPDSWPPTFLLDGQAVVLDDYLAVRPERAAEVASALRGGRLEAGPWYVLADELIPSGEALVRNLLAGRRTLRALRSAPPPLLYCPDSFGHPAMLPALAAGFGLTTAIVWRGYGGARWPGGDAMRWRAPDGSFVTTYHLPPGGYEVGSNLPADADAAADRWATLEPMLVSRSRAGVVLLPNGADHHALQREHEKAVSAIQAVAAPHKVIPGSLRGFAEALASAVGADFPTVSGELRDSYGYCWTLQGTFATRAAQKRANAKVERILVRESEAWSALVRLGGGRARQPLLAAAWKALLLCHPHDTLCGTSTDEVADAMNTRLRDASTQARAIRDAAVLDLVAHDPSAARTRVDDWRNVLLVRNPAPRTRSGPALLRVVLPRARVLVGPGSAPDPTAPPPSTSSESTPTLDGGAIPLQVIGRTMGHHRVESPRHYPYDELADVVDVVAWLPPVEGYSTRSIVVGESEPEARQVDTASAQIRNPVRDEHGHLTNGILRLTRGGAHGLSLSISDGGRGLESLLAVEIVRDAGDSYTHGPVGAVVVHEAPEARVVERGPLRGTVELRWVVTPPPWPRDARTAAGRSPDRGRITLRVRLSLVADSPLLRLSVSGTNRATDHRTRLLLRTGLLEPAVTADAAFGPVSRASLIVPPDEARVELPPPSAPMHRYVTLERDAAGATVFGDGLAEYEAMPDGTVAVTLLRAVGELSRNDIPERPGHAGWPVPTPGAQVPGRFDARFGLLLHDARTARTVDLIERTADDFLVPLAGTALRSALHAPAPSGGLTLEGRGLGFSCAKESEDGTWIVLRCVNLTEESVSGAWIMRHVPGEAVRSRLDETPGEPIVVAHGRIGFEAAPREVVTILVR